MKSILVTGGAGFIGSNFISYFLEKYKDYKIVNLDLLTYAADLGNLLNLENNKNYKFIKGDICDRNLLEYIFEKYDIRGVIHFAAESHVDNSIKNPGIFIETNILGTNTLVDVAQKFWMNKPYEYKFGYENCRFHHISTDEVYGTLDKMELFTENSCYSPSSPYSASKASSDMIIMSYHKTFGLDILITNCSNNYGPNQHDEKLIPTIIRNAIMGKPIPIYGDGENVRDWLYVFDHCSGIDLVYHNGKVGETYNIGARNERNNNYLVNKICELLDEMYPKKKSLKIKSYTELITYVDDRVGHDRRYAIDSTKIESELEWKVSESFETGIIKTIEWYLAKYK